MREITVKSKKYAGQHKVYELGEEGCPEINYKRETVKVGDWIIDCNNQVAKVLRMTVLLGKHQDIASIHILTCFGADILLNAGRGEVSYSKLDFNRPRLSFHSLSRGKDRTRGLTVSEKVFLYNTLITGDIDKAFHIAFNNTEIRSSTIHNKFDTLLKSNFGQEFIRNMIGEKLKEHGVDTKFFINKLIESVEGKIDTELKLSILRMLAAGAGDAEIVQMLSEQSNDNPNRPLLPVNPIQKSLAETNATDAVVVSSESLKV